MKISRYFMFNKEMIVYCPLSFGIKIKVTDLTEN